LKFLTVGCCTTDLILQVDRFALDDEEVSVRSIAELPGGSAANVAVGLSRLGEKAAYLGCLAEDGRGERNLEILQQEGVDTRHVVRSPKASGSPFVTAIVDEAAARQLYFYAGSAEELTPDAITRESLESVDCVHVCTLDPAFVSRVLTLRREIGPRLLVSADPGCVGLEGERVSQFRLLVPDLDFLFLNEVEFQRLFPGREPARLLELDSADLPARMIVKLGAQGACLYSREEGLHFQSALHVKVVDTTGAGDAFAAGFLAGIASGHDLRELGEFAGAVSAMCIARLGCRDGLPTPSEVRSFLKSGAG
jgi:sugar/nucleoside kinase (ribokinase family)